MLIDITLEDLSECASFGSVPLDRGSGSCRTQGTFPGISVVGVVCGGIGDEGPYASVHAGWPPGAARQIGWPMHAKVAYMYDEYQVACTLVEIGRELTSCALLAG